MEGIHIPAKHPVFQLVPPAFEELAETAYTQLGRPPVSVDTFWDIYTQLLNHFRNLMHNMDLTHILASHQEITQNIENETILLPPGLKELPNDDDVDGPDGNDEESLNTPGSSLVQNYATFTDEEDTSDDDG
jgi:hypothetical protein